MKPIVKLFLLAQFLDILTTLVGILYTGALEVNPIMNKVGLYQMLGIKFFVAIFVAVVLLTRMKKREGFATYLMYLSFVPPTWNFSVILSTILF